MLRPALVTAAAEELRALERERRRRPGPGRHAAVGGDTAASVQRGGARRRRAIRAALQARAAELRRLRREARVHAGTAADAGRLPRRPTGHADLRRHLVRRHGRSIWPPRAPSCCSCRTARRSRWRSRRSGSSSRASGWPKRGLPLVYVNQVGGQDELVFDGGSFVDQHRRRAGACALPSWTEALQLTRWGAQPGPFAAKARRRVGRGTAAAGGLPRDGAGPARLRAQEPLPRRGARPLGRHRLGADRGGGRGCARRRAGARRAATLALHQRRRASTTPRSRRGCSACALETLPIETAVAAVEEALAPMLRRAAARRRRREHAGAHPRRCC